MIRRPGTLSLKVFLNTVERTGCAVWTLSDRYEKHPKENHVTRRLRLSDRNRFIFNFSFPGFCRLYLLRGF
jgi:hypothetical protein